MYSHVDEENTCVTRDGRICQKMEEEQEDNFCPVCGDQISPDEKFCCKGHEDRHFEEMVIIEEKEE